MPNPLSALVPLGGKPDDPLKAPEIDPHGAPVLEDSEVLIYSGQHPVEINHKVGDTWRAALPSGKLADVVLTSRRLIVVWPNWKSDRALGSVFERRVVTRLIDRDEGRESIMAAHVRHQWIPQVSIRNPKGFMNKLGKLFVKVEDDTDLFNIFVEKFDPALAGDIAKRFAGEIAAIRLLERENIDMAQRERLQALSEGTADPDRVDWGFGYPIPGALRFPFSF